MKISIANRAGLIAASLALGLNAGAAAAQVVAVVSPLNPLTAMSRNQIVDIFLGKASRFPNGKPAVPIDQAEGSAVRNQFYLEFSGKSPSQLKEYWSKIIFTGRGQPPREAANGSEVKKIVGENPNAIGYIDSSRVDGSVKALLAQ